MPSDQDIRDQLELLQLHRDNLRNALRQATLQGGEAYALPAVQHSITEARACIADIKAVLRGWDAVVEDLPNDLPPSEQVVQHQEENPRLNTKATYIDLDKQIYHRLREILLWNGVILFLKDHYFGVSFYYEQIKPLYEFLFQSKDPAFEFIDVDLEFTRKELLLSIQKFLRHIGLYIWVMKGKSDSLSVAEKFASRGEAEWNLIVDSINEDSTQVVQKYEELVKLARRKLET